MRWTHFACLFGRSGGLALEHAPVNVSACRLASHRIAAAPAQNQGLSGEQSRERGRPRKDVPIEKPQSLLNARCNYKQIGSHREGMLFAKYHMLAACLKLCRKCTRVLQCSAQTVSKHLKDGGDSFSSPLASGLPHAEKHGHPNVDNHAWLYPFAHNKYIFIPWLGSAFYPSRCSFNRDNSVKKKEFL